MPDTRAVIVSTLGFVAGLGIGYVDSRPTWDDTGVTVGVVFLAAAVLAATRPRSFWLIGLAVGLPVLGMNVFFRASYASAIAVGIGLSGAGAGALCGWLLGCGGDRRQGTDRARG